MLLLQVVSLFDLSIILKSVQVPTLDSCVIRPKLELDILKFTREIKHRAIGWTHSDVSKRRTRILSVCSRRAGPDTTNVRKSFYCRNHNGGS